jgi:CRP/FNR family cyclic AMP-dependent transcriptional regulator
MGRGPPSLGRLAFFEGADAAALARAEAVSCTAEFAAGEAVLDFDCPSTEVRVVLRGGPLRVLMRASGGREKIVSEVGPGAFVGELAAFAGPALPPSAGIHAVNRTLVAVVPGEVFVDLILASPPLGKRLIAVLAERLRSQNRRLLEYAALPARQRLCAELLRLARPRPPEAGGGLAVFPPPTRPELAARIGARREAVSRELAELVRLGRLRVGPRAIVLLDDAALRAEVEAAMEAAKRLA